MSIQKVRPRHRIVIQLAFSGMTHKQIAEHTGYHPVAVSCILRSPVAVKEMSRMTAAAEGKIVELPLKMILSRELNESASEAVRLNRGLMRDPLTKTETRAKIARHFMDRVIFDKSADRDESQVSYRDLLRKLDSMDAKLNSVELARSNVKDAHESTVQENGSSENGSSSAPKETKLTEDHSLESFPRGLLTLKGGRHHRRVIDMGEDD